MNCILKRLVFLTLLVGTVLGQSSNATLIGRWANGPCYAVAVEGNYAYFGNGGYLEVVDISDPANPLEVGKVLLPSVVSGVAVSGSYAYVADGADGLRIIDVFTPSAPQEVGFFDAGGSAYGVAVSGSYAYVADEGAGLRIIDVSSPSSPQEVGFFDTGDRSLGVAVSGSYAYVADRDDGLRIINVSSPASPQEVGFFDTGDQAYGVAISGSYAYVADRDDGLYIIRNDHLLSTKDEDLSLPKSLTLHQNYPNPFNPVSTIQYDLPEAANVALVIYDILGREVITLINQQMQPGYHRAIWDARDHAGRTMPTGIYIARIVTPEYARSIKMLLLK